jgi:thiol-disulfide isomerase/thioredoxin
MIMANFTLQVCRRTNQAHLGKVIMKSPIKWILITIFFAVVFCVSFVYVYTKQIAKNDSITTKIEEKNEKPLPEAKFFNLRNEVLSDEKLRKGKVILIFVSPSCEACQTESEFLKDLINKRDDVKFYGIVSFGKAKETLEEAEDKFPFEMFYDAEALLTLNLKITKVPIKIYLEDGIIKKVWGGATTDEAKKQEFINWLENV